MVNDMKYYSSAVFFKGSFDGYIEILEYVWIDKTYVLKNIMNSTNKYTFGHVTHTSDVPYLECELTIGPWDITYSTVIEVDDYV